MRPRALDVFARRCVGDALAADFAASTAPAVDTGGKAARRPEMACAAFICFRVASRADVGESPAQRVLVARAGCGRGSSRRTACSLVGFLALPCLYHLIMKEIAGHLAARLKKTAAHISFRPTPGWKHLAPSIAARMRGNEGIVKRRPRRRLRSIRTAIPAPPRAALLRRRSTSLAIGRYAVLAADGPYDGIGWRIEIFRRCCGAILWQWRAAQTSGGKCLWPTDVDTSVSALVVRRLVI